MNPRSSAYIKSLAHDLGFLSCGVAKSTFLEEEARHFEQYIKEERHAGMAYMARRMDARLDPQRWMPSARSVVSVLYNYYPSRDLFKGTQGPKIARYAYGEDYHFVMKRKLTELLHRLREEWGEIEGRIFVDSSPVHERAWAQRSGLGWIGRNTLLLRKRVGSFFFLGGMLLDVDVEADAPATDHCGSCRACVDACPTDALTFSGKMDAEKCISYQTIENKEEISLPTQQMKGWVFGCDICQEVCPWNRFSYPHEEPTFVPHKALQDFPTQWQAWTQDFFQREFKRSALQRAGFKRLYRTLRHVIGP